MHLPIKPTLPALSSFWLFSFAFTILSCPLLALSHPRLPRASSSSTTDSFDPFCLPRSMLSTAIERSGPDPNVSPNSADQAEHPLPSTVGDVPETADFDIFLEHFQAIASHEGTMVCREGKNFSQTQFESIFPGQAFVKKPSHGYLYCKINRRHGIVCEKSPSTAGNRKSPCEYTVFYSFDRERMIYVVGSNSTTKHSHAINRHNIRASSRRLIEYER